MARKRKSRDQKIKADLRHKEYHLSSIYSPKPVQVQSIQVPSFEVPQVALSTSVNYLQKDLTKTFITTALILGFQIVSLLILHHHSINLFGTKVSY